jgi:hypothetical protein
VVGWCVPQCASVILRVYPYQHLVAPTGRGLRSCHDRLGGLGRDVSTRWQGFVQLTGGKSVGGHNVVEQAFRICAKKWCVVPKDSRKP